MTENPRQHAPGSPRIDRDSLAGTLAQVGGRRQNGTQGAEASEWVAARFGPVVILAGPAVDAVAYAVTVARRGLRTPSRHLDRLAGVLGSPEGHTDVRAEPIGESEPVMSTSEAAAVLGVTHRHARRLAPALDGRFVAGRWLIPATAIDEHLEGMTP